jgi:hypothetical protein
MQEPELDRLCAKQIALSTPAQKKIKEDKEPPTPYGAKRQRLQEKKKSKENLKAQRESPDVFY